MDYRVALCAFLVLSIQAAGTEGFTCTLDEMWRFYRLSALPVEFNGTNTAPDLDDTDTSRCLRSQGVAALCAGRSSSGGGVATLADNDLGPEELDVSKVNAWNQSFSIQFDLASSSRITAVNLFFYNIPSMGIGLPPNIELFHSNDVTSVTNPITNFLILNNEDLSQNDSQLRNVTLVVTDTTVPTHSFFRIQFEFSQSHPIDWILLSEVQLCTSTSVTIPTLGASSLANDANVTIPLGPIDNVVSSYTLVCSIAGEGRFQWMWSFPSPSVQYRQYDVDGTRTSNVELLNINAATGYGGDYQCQPMYHDDAQPNNPELSIAPKVFTLDLQFDLSASSTTPTFTSEDTFVSVACELSGYVPSQQSNLILWRYNNMDISNALPYEITTEDGDNFIQDGGDSTGPSLRSVLTINVNSGMEVEGSYLCRSQSHVVQISLTMVGIRDVTTPPPPPPTSIPATSLSPTSTSTSSSQETQPPAPPDDGSTNPISLNLIIGAAVGGLVVIVYL